MSPCSLTSVDQEQQQPERERETEKQIVCPWSTVQHQVNARLLRHQLSALSQQEALLLYIVILTLYDEGIRPTYPEVHNKLKEHNASDELLSSFVSCYFLQLEWYKICRSSQSQSLATETDEELSTSLKSIAHLEDAAIISKRTPQAKRAALDDFVIYFRCDPIWWRGWVDLRDPVNQYSAQIWIDFLDFLRDSSLDAAAQSNRTDSLRFEHTRYALAKAMKKLGPPSVRQLRLGDIAHLIQLSLQHGILCYESTTIQPCWTSYTLASARSLALNLDLVPEKIALEIKNRSASERDIFREAQKIEKETHTQSVCDLSTRASSNSQTSAPSIVEENNLSHDQCETAKRSITSICELRRVLTDLIQRHQGGRILLSQLRALLEAEHGLALRPSQFGYSKLSDLISDHLSDICTLTRHRSRHVFIEAFEEPAANETGVKARSRTTPRVNLGVLAEEHRSAVVDLWRSSAMKAVEEWSLADLRALDREMSERNAFFPSNRRPLTREDTHEASQGSGG